MLEETMSWSDLPDDALLLILTNLCSLIDVLSFSFVCKSWRAVANSLSPSRTASLFPPLLLCPILSDGQRLSSLRLVDPATPSFSTSLQRFANKFVSIYCGGLSCSYSHGCLLRVNNDKEVLILNPFTGVEICSPVFPRTWFLACPVLTSPLSSPDCAVIQACRGTLFYWRVGTPSWSSCKDRIGYSGIVSVATLEGKIYVSKDGALFQLHLTPELHLTNLAVVPGCSQGCLVECAGELLSLRLVTVRDINAARFELFRLDTSGNVTRWVKKKTEGNWAFFVGADSRVPGIAVENPERWGGRSNCVYFAKQNEGGESPWVVVQLGDEVSPFESPFNGNYATLSPAWVPRGFYHGFI